MAEFQRFQEAPQFNPMSIIESGERVAKQGQQIIEALQTYQGQVTQRDQNLVEDSAYNQNAEVLKSIGAFSKSAVDTVKKIEQQNAKNREIDAQYQSIYNPEFSPEEQAIYDAAAVQQQTAGVAANRLEEAGDDLGAEALRQDLNQVGQGVQNEMALLTRARTNFNGEVLQIISDNKELSQLYATDPNAALEIATKLFIDKYGLQYTTKNAFVGVMGGTIRNTIQNLSTQQMTQIIKERRDQNLVENDATTANLTSTFLTGSQDLNDGKFQGLSDTYLYDNNGILTRGAANRRAATALLTQAANSGNVDLVAAVGRTNVNGVNTPISNTYPIEYTKALDDAEKRRQELKRAQRQTILDQTGEMLDAATTAEQRTAILNQAMGQLDFQGRIQLGQQYGTLVADPDQMATFQSYSNNIAAGQAYSPEEIDSLRANNRITTQQATSLKQQSKKLVDRTLQLGETDLDGSKTRFDNALVRVTGLAIDPATSYIVSTKDKTPITATQARNISKSFNRDQRLYVRTKIEQMNVGEMSIEERANLVRDLAQEFFEKETQNPSGKYWLGGAFTQSGKVQPDSDEFENIRIDANLFGVPVTPRVDNGVKNWSTEWTPAAGTASIKGEYKPGDVVFSLQDTKRYADELGTTGINPEVAEIAQQLGVTPLQLLQDSGVGYNIPMNPANDGQVGAAVKPPANWKPYQSKHKPIYARLIPLLLGQGYTPQGAAALVGILRVETVLAYKNGDPKGSIDTWGSTTLPGRDPLKNVITRLNTLAGDDPIFTDPKASVRQLERHINASGAEGHPYGQEIRELLRLAGYQL